MLLVNLNRALRGNTHIFKKRSINVFRSNKRLLIIYWKPSTTLMDRHKRHKRVKHQQLFLTQEVPPNSQAFLDSRCDHLYEFIAMKNIKLSIYHLFLFVFCTFGWFTAGLGHSRRKIGTGLGLSATSSFGGFAHIPWGHVVPPQT